MKKTLTLAATKLAALSMFLITGFAFAETVPGASYTRPDADLSKYDKVLLRALRVDDMKVLKPVWAEDDESEWVMRIDALQSIQNMYSEIMTEQLEADGGYPVVDEPGDNVLRVEVELLSITPYMKPGSKGNKGKFVYSTLGSGEVVVSAEMRDSLTRELLVLIEGERTIGTEYRELSVESHQENVRGLFNQWGERLRARLDSSRASTE
jgi:hypothetical protein